MRLVPSFLLVLTLAAPAAAAPICQNRLGDFVHCEAKEAMPLGWHVPDAAYTARVLSRTPPARTGDLLAAGAVLACLFALIALLPKFDGAKGEDWSDGDWQGQDK